MRPFAKASFAAEHMPPMYPVRIYTLMEKSKGWQICKSTLIFITHNNG